MKRDVVFCRSLQKTIADTYKHDYQYQFREGDQRSAGHLRGPLHVITEKSVQDVQSYLDEDVCKIRTEQFRANIIIDGTEPWEEEEVREFEIVGKNATFRVLYNSKRCKLINYSIPKAKKNDLGEPLNTINKIKHLKGIGPVFGWFIAPDQECEIEVGDKIRYTKKVSRPLTFQD